MKYEFIMNEKEIEFLEKHPGLKKYFLTGKYGDKHSSILLPKVRQIIHETQIDKINLLKVIEECTRLDGFGRSGSEHINPRDLKKELGLE